MLKTARPLVKQNFHIPTSISYLHILDMTLLLLAYFQLNDNCPTNDAYFRGCVSFPLSNDTAALMSSCHTVLSSVVPNLSLLRCALVICALVDAGSIMFMFVFVLSWFLHDCDLSSPGICLMQCLAWPCFSNCLTILLALAPSFSFVFGSLLARSFAPV